MKFLMLVRKELRETLPWLLLAGLALLVVGAFLLRAEMQFDRPHWAYSRFEPGTTVATPRLLSYYSALSGTAVWLCCVSLALGMVLAVVQFWLPGFTKTWPFLLHRSTGRATILAAKLTAAVAGFGISLGTVWIILYAYASWPGVFPIPPAARIFANGWIYMAWGLVAYLGIVLTGLSSARWYTTKIFGLIFAWMAILAGSDNCTFFWACIIIVFTGIILLAQICNAFLKREY